MSDAPKLTTLEPETLKQLTPEQLVSIIEQQQALIAQQQALIGQLQQEIDRLKANQGSDSRTSSKPPSTDLLKKSEKPKDSFRTAEEGKRKPGGQPGHPGKTRKGFDRVDRYETLRPERCPRCGSASFLEAPVAVERQQVARLVEQPIEVVDYHRHCCQCACCADIVAAPWAEDIVPGQDLSIGLQSLLVWLGNKGHLSYEKQQELIWELGQLDIGVGTLQATTSRMAVGVALPVESLWEWAQQQSHVHVDETPWPVMGVKEWLWVATGKAFCLFHAGDSRSRIELETMLGSEFLGVLSSDDFSVYNGYPVKAQQKCLAHLRRHFKKVLQLKHGNNPQVGQAFLDLIDEAFAQHRQWRETQDGAAYRTWAESFKIKLQLCLQQWLGNVGYAAGLLLRSLQDKTDQWWYFQGPSRGFPG